MEVREFQTESRRLLDLMINSIYTNKDIFLRELISNASDAIDKLKYYSATNANQELDLDSKIVVTINKEARTIVIKDNGIGLTKDELVNNLGTIAHSGTKEFMESINEKTDFSQIGQFGVGFYSAFMVSKKVEVITKSPKEDKAYLWRSEGLSNYEIEETTSDIKNGSEIILYLRDDDDDFNYSKYLEEWQIKDLITTYSDFIKYPIQMLGEAKEGEVAVLETINSMKPVWKKSKEELKENELEDFFKSEYHDYVDPFDIIKFNVEGNLTYTALLYIPGHFDELSFIQQNEKGLDLYSKGVFIKSNTKELLPDYLGFIKGVVDSDDLSLNISREILQENKDLLKIRDNIEKKVLKELSKIKEKEFDRYITFWNQFGRNIKFGVYNEFGARKDQLQDLLLFESRKQKKLISLKEYVENFREGQTDIYYLSNATSDNIKLKKLDDLGYDVLMFNDAVDEFVVKMLQKYEDHDFKSITSGNLDLDSETEKETLKEQQEASKDLLDKIKDADKSISKVELTNDLVDDAYTLESGELSFEMERVYKAQGNDYVKAERILKFNPNHPLFKKLQELNGKGEDISDYIYVLYNQALLSKGLDIESKEKLNEKIVNLLLK